MTIRLALVLLAAAWLAATPAQAQGRQDLEALRRELEDMRRQLQATQDQYQKHIDVLSERIRKLEAQPQAAVEAPRPGPPAMAAEPPPAAPTLLDLLTPRPPFSLAGRSGKGGLLFDIGVAGDFVAAFSGKKVDDADVGTFPGRENRFFTREIDLRLFGAIDPYSRGEVLLEAAEEFENGDREFHLGLSEAHLTLTSLPWGFQAKMGQLRNRFGLLNERHQHDLPQIDRPNVLVNFFGEEGLVERGLELSWVAPLPVYLEALAGVFDGDNDVAFGRGSLRAPMVTGRLRTFFELGAFGALQLGASVATGETPERLRNTVVGVDAKYKLTPEGWRHSLLTVAAEALIGWRRTAAEGACDGGNGAEIDGNGGDCPAGRRTLRRGGFYAYGEVQPWRRWLGGVRFDYSYYPAEAGKEWAIGPYLTFRPSEFLRFRLGFKHTHRDRCDLFATPEGACARIANEVFLQGTFILGAHPAHPF